MNNLRNLIPHQRLATPFKNQTAIIHGGDYNPDQWLSTVPDILEQDADLMQATGINSATVGIFSWSALEPEQGKFTFEWLDRVMEKQASIGNRVILATPSGAMPTWLAETYPDARRVDRQGRRSHYGNRHNHCWSSPSYHERVQSINSELAARYGRHPALAMWHVSNELSGECFCDLCRAEWTSWLEKKYGTVAKMNDAHWAGFWSHQSSEWRHAEPTDGVMDGLVLDWNRFANQQLIEWYEFEAQSIRSASPGVPITTNFMTTSYNHDYQAISRVVDVVADDQYPWYDPDQSDMGRYAAFWSMKQDLYRCFKPDRTFMLMESCPGAVQWRSTQKLKRPDVHRLEMLQAIAHGADGVCYFQFRAGRGSMEKLHGAVVEHWDTKHVQTRRYRELKALSDSFDKFKPLMGTSVTPQVAMVYDWQSKWGQRLSYGTGVRMPDWTAHELNHYDDVAVDHYLNFWSRGIPVDVISNERDLSPYQLVVLPMHWVMTPGFATRIREFVAKGGTVVATWDTAMADANNRMLLGGWPGEGLAKVFGLWIEEIDRLKPGTRRAIKGLAGSGGDVAAVMHLDGAYALAEFDEDYYRGSAAVTVNQFGRGRAYFVGTRLDAIALSAMYSQIVAKCELIRVFDADLPEGVTAQLRGVGDEAFVFLLNFSKSAQSISLGNTKLQSLESGESIHHEITLAPLAADVYRLV